LTRFLVSIQGEKPTAIEAGSWLAALGLGLDQFDKVGAIDRLACEVLSSGAVVARDARSGETFVIQAMSSDGEVAAETYDDDAPTIVAGEDFDDGFMEEEDTDELSVRGDDGIMSFGVVALFDQIQRARSDVIAWDVALGLARDRAGGQAGAAIRQDEDGALRFVATFGPHGKSLLGVRLPARTGIVGFCIDRRVCLILRQPSRDPRFYKGIDEATGFSTNAVLCVPVVRDDRCFGALELLNPPEDVPFARAHLEIVELIASSLAERLAFG
jgi:GAF domain-containing protein